MATARPLGYYAVLSRLDTSWELAEQVNRHDAWPLWPLLAVLAPLGVLAGLAYRRPGAIFEALALRLWPEAALAVYATITYTPVGTFPLHSVQGLSIPLAILSAVRLGQTVPGLTGRRTWVGIASWTPDLPDRVRQAAALFAGELEPEAARSFVTDTDARFLLADCTARGDPTGALAPLASEVTSFGCATVYDLG